MTSLVVRNAREHELDVVASVLRAAFDPHLRWPDESTTPELRLALQRYREDIVDVRSRRASADLLVAESDGRIVGAATLQRPFAPSAYPGHGRPKPWPPDWASFRLLAVLPEARATASASSSRSLASVVPASSARR